MQKTKKDLLLKLLVAVTFAAMVIVNSLANTLPINGKTTGEVSYAYENLFTPSGFTFAIWGLIYVLLAFHACFELGLFRGCENKACNDVLEKIAVIFSVTSLINTAWVFVWHYDLIPLSMLLMVCLLVCLIYIETIINKQSMTLREKLLFRLPFSIYFGWITVAAIANATVLLVNLGWDGFGISQPAWTIIILAVGAVIAAVTMLRFKDIAYGLVPIWAYFGILIKHTSASGYSGKYPGVITTIIFCIALFIAAEIYNIIAVRRKKEK
jgi:hypothetical protein